MSAVWNEVTTLKDLCPWQDNGKVLGQLVLSQLIPTSQKVYLSGNSSPQTHFSDNSSPLVKMCSCQTTCPQNAIFLEYRWSKEKSFQTLNKKWLGHIFLNSDC